MIEGGGGLGFALEALQGLAVLGERLGQELERHERVQPGVFAFVDHALTAGAQFLEIR